MFMPWWTYLKKLILKKVYRFLVVKTQVIDKTGLYHYQRYPTFATINLQSNKGVFTFVFKEDRRKRVRGKDLGSLRLTSYFVELEAPPSLAGINNPLQGKVIVVFKIGIHEVNYAALGELLLDLYVDCF